MGITNIFDPPPEQPKQKDFTERLIELIKNDKELHDSVVRLINAMAAEKELKTSMLRKRRRQVKTEDIEL